MTGAGPLRFVCWANVMGTVPECPLTPKPFPPLRCVRNRKGKERWAELNMAPQTEESSYYTVITTPNAHASTPKKTNNVKKHGGITGGAIIACHAHQSRSTYAEDGSLLLTYIGAEPADHRSPGASWGIFVA